MYHLNNQSNVVDNDLKVGFKLSGSAADLGFSGGNLPDSNSCPTNGMHPCDYSDDDDTDSDTTADDASFSGHSDSGVDSLSLMELASKW